MKNLNREEYWQMVKNINWPSFCRKKNSTEIGKRAVKKELNYDDNAIHASLMLNSIYGMTLAYLDALDMALRDYWLTDWNRKNAKFVSDDGYHDLRCHIIGCGLDAYEKAIKCPETVYDNYVKDNNYVENFLYCFNIE